jgi:hypothetical protein
MTIIIIITTILIGLLSFTAIAVRWNGPLLGATHLSS